MVCINGCCGHFFVFDQTCANFSANSPCATPPLHSTSTHILHTYIHLQPPPLLAAATKQFWRKKAPDDHTFCTRWAQILHQLDHKKAPEKHHFFSQPKSFSFSTALLRQHEQILHQLGAPFWRKNARWAQILHQIGAPFWGKKRQMSTNFAPARSTILRNKSTRWAQNLHQLGAPFWGKKHPMSTNFAPARSTILRNKSTRWAQNLHQLGAPFWKKKHQMSTNFAPARSNIFFFQKSNTKTSKTGT